MAPRPAREISVPISPSRIAAFDVLLRVEKESAYAAELLHSDKVTMLDARDRNLAMQIVMGALRWQSRLDSELSRFLSGKNEIHKLDAEVRIALRMATYQLRHLDRVPANAAVNDSVQLVKRAGKTSASPLVNAVLRKLTKAPPEAAPPFDSPQALADSLSHPLWLVERWARDFGLEKTRRICEANQSQPATSLRMPADPTQIAAAEAALRDAGIELSPGVLMTNARRVISGDITSAAEFREMRVGIQDEASQLVAALVGRGKRILDCCAAPGGKTQAIASRNPQAHIVAAELHPQRARIMRDLVTAKNVEIVAADIATLKVDQPFDRVLADVPCSGTGTLARNPEIKWRLKPEDFADLQRRQVAILSAALDRAASGARVIYSTCSLERDEDEKVVEEILSASKDIRIVPVKDVLRELKQNHELAWQDLDSITSSPFLRTLPGVHPCDGFFAAVLEKVSVSA